MRRSKAKKQEISLEERQRVCSIGFSFASIFRQIHLRYVCERERESECVCKMRRKRPTVASAAAERVKAHLVSFPPHHSLSRLQSAVRATGAEQRASEAQATTPTMMTTKIRSMTTPQRLSLKQHLRSCLLGTVKDKSGRERRLLLLQQRR